MGGSAAKSSAKNKINNHEEEKQPSSAIQIKSVSSMETPKGDSKLNTLNKKQDASGAEMKPITDKYFYKEMAKIKEKGAKGVNAVPPKKSASAYIIFQKEVSLLSQHITPSSGHLQPVNDRNILNFSV